MINLDTAVDRLQIKTMCYKLASYQILALHPLRESAYTFDCTFFMLICLTAKALRRMTMFGSHATLPCAAPLRGGLRPCKSAVLPICLVGATELKKRCAIPVITTVHTLKRVQLQFLG